MKRGILRGCIASNAAGIGQVAIEDTETHKLELVIYDLKPTFKALEPYKGKEVYWNLDKFGMLAWFKPVRR